MNGDVKAHELRKAHKPNYPLNGDVKAHKLRKAQLAAHHQALRDEVYIAVSKLHQFHRGIPWEKLLFDVTLPKFLSELQQWRPLCRKLRISKMRYLHLFNPSMFLVSFTLSCRA